MDMRKRLNAFGGARHHRHHRHHPPLLAFTGQEMPR